MQLDKAKFMEKKGKMVEKLQLLMNDMNGIDWSQLA
jgi:hypothetical protein